ncbi:MAG: tetratricopeptide repeat protein [Myxococcota bacterium]
MVTWLLTLVLSAAAASPADLERANTLLAAGDVAGAEVVLRELLAATPDDPALAAQLGYALLEQRKLDEAGAVLTATLEAHPDHGPSRWYLGMIRVMQRDDRSTVDVLQPLVATLDPAHPQWIGLHRFLANAYAVLLRREPGLDHDETDRLVASCRILAEALPDTSEGAQMAVLGALVEQRRPARSVARWTIVTESPDTVQDNAVVVHAADPIERKNGRRGKRLKGYDWVDCADDLGCRFLAPEGWFVRQESDATTLGVFVTLQEIAPPTMRFETGVTINRIADATARTGHPPSQYALGYLKQIARAEGARLERASIDGFEVLLARDAITADGQLRKHYLLAANDASDVLFITFFEAPANQWEQHFGVAAPILDPAWARFGPPE